MQRNEITIDEFVGEKTAAKVGNAPSELRLGKGEKIDSHDLVVRLNDYQHGPSKNNDYGKKVDLWCTAFQSKIPKEPPRFIVPSMNYYLNPVGLAHVTELHKCCVNHAPRVINMQQRKTLVTLMNSADVLFPSSGL